MASTKRLSKSKYVAGLQCPKRLWWTVHEPDAPELAADPAQEAILDRGQRIGDLARAYVPGGTLIDLPHYEVTQRVAATAKALAAGAPVVYEASFVEDDIFVSVDILERRKRAFVLTEVKSTTNVKPQHLADVAVQVHVVRRAGLTVERAEVMHLNSACRHPRLKNLFVRKAVTRQIGQHLRAVPKEAGTMLAMLAGPLPTAPTGAHCDKPYPCPFIERCWPVEPEHHVRTLFNIRGAKIDELLAAGHETVDQIPRNFPATGPAKRQIKSIKKKQLVVERGLRGALRALKRPIAFLDFETVNPAVPVWPGCGPYGQVPVQFSCHVLGARGAIEHHEWLVDGPGDPRAALARALVDACEGAATIVAYNKSFEGRCVAGLAESVPSLAGELATILERLHDLLPIVRDHVYHPEFGGSFSLKSVLPALVADLNYDDLEIADGGTAATALESLLLGENVLPDAERKKLRRDLLRYCERDTLAMVRLYARLGELGTSG